MTDLAAFWLITEPSILVLGVPSVSSRRFGPGNHDLLYLVVYWIVEPPGTAVALNLGNLLAGAGDTGRCFLTPLPLEAQAPGEDQGQIMKGEDNEEIHRG